MTFQHEPSTLSGSSFGSRSSGSSLGSSAGFTSGFSSASASRAVPAKDQSELPDRPASSEPGQRMQNWAWPKNTKPPDWTRRWLLLQTRCWSPLSHTHTHNRDTRTQAGWRSCYPHTHTHTHRLGDWVLLGTGSIRPGPSLHGWLHRWGPRPDPLWWGGGGQIDWGGGATSTVHAMLC